jgi:hypothetical protein
MGSYQGLTETSLESDSPVIQTPSSTIDAQEANYGTI